VSRAARLWLFSVSGAALAALMVWALTGLPDFGDFQGEYGRILNSIVQQERHVSNVVAAVVFDYRVFDTLGEEFMLFTAVMGVALLLREARDVGERPEDAVRSDAVGAIGDLGSRLGHTDELILHGRGRGLRLTGGVLAVGALGLAVLPPFGTFVAFGLVGHAAGLAGYGWLPVVLVVATALTGGAVLRAAGRIFLGLGPRRDDALVTPPAGEEEEEAEPRRRRGFLLSAPAVVLLVAGLGLPFTPGLPARAVQHAERFVDRSAVAKEALHDVRAPLPPLHTVHVGGGAYVCGGVSVVLAVGFAWLGLYRRRLPVALRGAATRLGGPPIHRLNLLHDGVVGE
jgi:hypothetical protein